MSILGIRMELARSPSRSCSHALHPIPVSFREACRFIQTHHRHLRPPVGHKFSLAVAKDGPRQTEERLRNYLDGDQPARERMCLALLPLLGPFTECRPRRPKGGRDGGRDIECLRDGVVTFGAVGFRNGGGNDNAARTGAQAKFRKDLNSSRKAAPDLKSFVFCTNVDLTPAQKDELIAHAEKKGIAAQVFDMEILRQALDSKDGLHIREHYLGISATGGDDEWKRLQASKIASYTVPIRLPKGPHGRVTDEAAGILQDTLGRILAYSFGHVCLTSPFDDFVFILSVEPDNRETELVSCR